MTAMKKLTTNTASNPDGFRASRKAASSGPTTAPSVSKARWTPKEAPSLSRALLSEMSASRGAVRMPLPSRSR